MSSAVTILNGEGKQVRSAGRQEAIVKRFVLMAALVGAVSTAIVYAQAPASARKPASNPAEGHSAPKTQPATAPAAEAPAGAIALGSVRIPKGVKADGKPLPAGTYQVRVTTDAPSQAAPGESQGLERWAEFLKSGKVVGREVVTIVPKPEVKEVQKDTPPAANSAKVETLKGGAYLRVWFNKGGNHYLMHLPTA
jgi:hypothetical protein